MLARFAGTGGAVEYQLARAAELVEGLMKEGAAEPVEDDDDLWARLSTTCLRTDGPLVWRASVLPSALGSLLARLGDDYGRKLSWHAGAGDGRLRVCEDAQDHGGAVAFLRDLREAAREAGGSLVVERAPERLKRTLGAWGLTDSTEFLSKRLKGQLDPSDTFAPGCFDDSEVEQKKLTTEAQRHSPVP
jgi:FAD/FMN-containing dehydrogenase